MNTVPSRRLFDQILFTRDDLRPGRTLLFRIGLVLALLALVFLVLWIERDGRLVEMYLFAAVVYFAVCFVASMAVRRLQKKIAIIR